MSKRSSPSHRRILAGFLVLFRLLLLAYPASFRRAYGAEMLQTFRESCRQADQERGVLGLLRMWGPILSDLFHTALAEWYLEATTMTRHQFIRSSGLLTLLSTIPFSLLVLDGEIATRLIPGYVGLGNLLERGPVAGVGVFVLLGFDLSLALCFVFGTLGLWVLQRTRLSRIATGLAFLGQVVNGVLWVVLHTSPLPPKSLVPLGLGLIICGIFTLRSHLLPHGNILPLLLGCWLVGISLRYAIPLPSVVISHYAVFTTVGFLVMQFLWGWVGYALWARKEGELVHVVPQVG